MSRSVQCAYRSKNLRVQLQMEIRKISRQSFAFSKRRNSHFPLLFCGGRLRNIQRLIAIVLIIKPFFWRGLVAVAVVVLKTNTPLKKSVACLFVYAGGPSEAYGLDLQCKYVSQMINSYLAEVLSKGFRSTPGLLQLSISRNSCVKTDKACASFYGTCFHCYLISIFTLSFVID